MPKKFHILLFAASALIGCQAQYSSEAQSLVISYKQPLQQQATERGLVLDSLQKDQLYALGEIAGSQGFVLYWDGEGTLIQVEDSLRSKELSPAGKEAEFLLYSYVKEWVRFPLPDSLFLPSYFKSYLAVAAAERGLDPTKAFPFLLTGKISRASWEVENANKSQSAKKAQGIIEGLDLDILGFHLPADKNENGQNQVFMYFRSKDGTLAGKIDKLFPGPNMRLALPTAH